MNIECIARGICLNNDKILLAYLKKGDYYFLPGGHVETGESIFTTLERELLEEASIKTHGKELVLVLEHLWQNKGEAVHEINYVITYELENDQSVQSTEEHLEFRWIAVKDLNDITFMPKEALPTIERVRSGNRSIEFLSTIRTIS